MKIEKETVQKLLVKDVQGLDPISIYLEDLGTGQGKVTITCFGESWTSTAQFVMSCDNHYLAKNLSKIPCEIDDLTGLQKDLVKVVFKKRREKELNATEARDLYDKVDGLRHLEPSEILTKHDLLYALYGDEWWYCIPKKPNPDYEYLCRIITTVKEALKKVA